MFPFPFGKRLTPPSRRPPPGFDLPSSPPPLHAVAAASSPGTSTSAAVTPRPSKRRKRKQKSEFLGVFPPEKGSCSCAEEKTKERVASYNSTPAAGDSTDDEDEVVIVPFSPSLRLEPSEDEEEVQDTSEEEDDDDWSPPVAKRARSYHVSDSEGEQESTVQQLSPLSSPESSRASSPASGSSSVIVQATLIAAQILGNPRSLTSPRQSVAPARSSASASPRQPVASTSALPAPRTAPSAHNRPPNKYIQTTCHHDKTRSDRPVMYCTEDTCSTRWCNRCIEKYYPDTTFIRSATFLCPLCRDICSCAQCRRKRAARLGREVSPAPGAAGRSGRAPGPTKGSKPVTRKNVVKLKAPPKKEKVKKVRETVWEVEDEEEWREGSLGVSSLGRGGGTPWEEGEEESEDDVGERRRKKQRSLRRGSTSSSARTPAEGNGLLRPAPVRITRTQARTLSEVRDESLRTAEREQSQSQSQEGFSWQSEKAAKGKRWGGSELSGSDLEGLELEEEEEESEEEEEPETSMWSSAGGLWGPGPSGEPTLVLPDPLDQGLPSLAHDAPLLPSNSSSDDLSLLFPQLPLADPLPSPSSAEGLVNSALDSLDMPAPTGNSASAANMSMSSGNGGSQSKRKMKVVWREGPERRRRRLSEMEAGNGGGEASSPESDSNAPEPVNAAGVGPRPPGSRKRRGSSSGSMGAPPPYSPSREKEQAAPKHAESSCRQASSVSQQHQQQQQQTQSQYQNQYHPFIPPPPQQQQPFQPYAPPQALFHPPPTRPASSLANYDPRGSISGVRSSTSTPQYPPYSRPSPVETSPYLSNFTHLSAAPSPSTSPGPRLPSPQLGVQHYGLHHELQPQQQTSTYFLPPSAVASSSDGQLASFMRLAASGGVHGAMALNAFSQSVFMEAVASTLDRGAGAGADGGGRMEGVPRLTWGADAAGGGAGGVQSERVSNPWRSGGRGDAHLGVGTSAGAAEGGHGAELHTPNWGAGGHEEAWSGGWSSTGHNQQQDFGGDGMGMGLAWP